MNNYDRIKHKIKFINDNLIIKGDNLNALKTKSPNLISLNYIKNKESYLIDEYNMFNLTINAYNIYLVDFPENFLSFVKVFPLLTTLEGNRDRLAIVTFNSNYFEYFIKAEYNSTNNRYDYILNIHYWISFDMDSPNYLVNFKLFLFLDNVRQLNELRKPRT